MKLVQRLILLGAFLSITSSYTKNIPFVGGGIGATVSFGLWCKKELEIANLKKEKARILRQIE